MRSAIKIQQTSQAKKNDNFHLKLSIYVCVFILGLIECEIDQILTALRERGENRVESRHLCERILS